MELQEFKQHLDGRLDKLEDKLDNHLERIAKTEVSIDWIRGHIKLVMTLVVAALSGLATAVYQMYLSK